MSIILPLLMNRNKFVPKEIFHRNVLLTFWKNNFQACRSEYSQKITLWEMVYGDAKKRLDGFENVVRKTWSSYKIDGAKRDASFSFAIIIFLNKGSNHSRIKLWVICWVANNSKFRVAVSQNLIDGFFWRNSLYTLTI